MLDSIEKQEKNSFKRIKDTINRNVLSRNNSQRQVWTKILKSRDYSNMVKISVREKPKIHCPTYPLPSPPDLPYVSARRNVKPKTPNPY